LIQKRFLFNVHFLCKEKQEILLKTLTDHSQDNCKLSWQVACRFKTHEWSCFQKLSEKFLNFNKCPMRISSFRNAIPTILRDEMINGTTIYHGRVMRMITTLAELLNFTIKLDYNKSTGGWDHVIEKAIKREADFIIANLVLKYSRTELMDYSNPYGIVELSQAFEAILEKSLVHLWMSSFIWAQSEKSIFESARHHHRIAS